MKQYEIRLDWLGDLPSDPLPPSTPAIAFPVLHATRLWLIPEDALGEGTEFKRLCAPSERFYGDKTYFLDGSVSLTAVEEGGLQLCISYPTGNGRWGERETHLLPLGEELSYRVYQYESTMGDVYDEFDESYRISFRLREEE